MPVHDLKETDGTKAGVGKRNLMRCRRFGCPEGEYFLPLGEVGWCEFRGDHYRVDLRASMGSTVTGLDPFYSAPKLVKLSLS